MSAELIDFDVERCIRIIAARRPGVYLPATLRRACTMVINGRRAPGWAELDAHGIAPALIHNGGECQLPYDCEWPG